MLYTVDRHPYVPSPWNEPEIRERLRALYPALASLD